MHPSVPWLTPGCCGLDGAPHTTAPVLLPTGPSYTPLDTHPYTRTMPTLYLQSCPPTPLHLQAIPRVTPEGTLCGAVYKVASAHNVNVMG